MTARQIGPGGMTAFVPNGDSRQNTAILLIGSAREHDMDDSLVIRATQGGFFISDELADVLYDEPEDEAPEPAKPAKKTSGNRAAKNSTTEQEQS